MGYQGMLIEMAKEYVVLATSQSQSLMCGGQMSCNKHAIEGWPPVEPQIVWNRSAVLRQASPAKPEHQHHQQQHYVAVGHHQQLAEKTPEPAILQPRLPQRNHPLDSPGPSARDDEHRRTPAVDKSKEAATKSKKRFRIFRAMRSVIKSRFRK